MKRSELVQMVDPVRFRSLLAKAKISDEAKDAIVRDRSKWLWDNYQPEDMEWHRQIYGR
jgi:hypothetical protein